MFQSIYNPFPAIPVRLSKESITVPDMSYTPREIISKFSRGERVPLGFSGRFDSEDNPEDDRYQHYPSDELSEDPTRDPSFDQFDYVEEKHALDERVRERARRSKVKNSEDSKRKASAEDLSANDETTRETTSDESPNSSVEQSASE